MTQSPAGQLARSQQRRWLSVLCAFTGLAIIQQLCFPQQPPLPVPPTSTSMPTAWRGGSLVEPGSKEKVFLRNRNVTSGLGQRFSKGKEWLLLTPLGSWKQGDLEPAQITSGSPQQQLHPATVLTFAASSQQIAMGRIQGVLAYQSCLTKQGVVAFRADKLGALSGRSHQDFLRTLINGRLPASPRASYSCLLITTNSRSILHDSPESRQFLAKLTSLTKWPQ